MKSKRIFHCVGQIIRILVFAVIAGILVGNIYIAAAKHIAGQTNPTFFGFSDSVVLTGSMSGTIEPYDIILTHKQASYAIGDIITFRSENVLVTHRIIAVEEDGYRTKGDANNVPDARAVAQESVTGKVIFIIPKLGSLLLFAKTPVGMLSVLALAIGMIELPNIVNYIKKRKAK